MNGHRRRALVGVAVAGAVIAAAAWWASGSPADPVAPGAWTSIAASPLSPRGDPAAVWTGDEMLVLGGRAGASPCPPNADCQLGPPLRDGAAYDPATDTWRPITDLPTAFVPSSVTRIGGRVLVLGHDDSTTRRFGYTYDPDTDTWDQVGTPSVPVYGPGVPFGRGRAFVASEEPRRGAGIALFDPRGERWTTLPDDPWGPTYDRSLAWSGHELYLTAIPPGAADGFGRYRLARLRPGDLAWEDLGETPVVGWDPVWAWLDGHLVNPSQYALSGDEDGGSSGIWDPLTDRWRGAPQLEERHAAACPLPFLGRAGDWLVTDGGALVSTRSEVVLVAPPCGGLVDVQAAVWTGSEILAYGGTDASYSRILTEGYRWSPPGMDEE